MTQHLPLQPGNTDTYLCACHHHSQQRACQPTVMQLIANLIQTVMHPHCDPCCVTHPAQVRSVSVQPRRIPLAELQVAAPRLERRTSVEASMRLDALASAGFRVSRSAMTDLIKKGDVRCVCMLSASLSRVTKAVSVLHSELQSD